MDSAVLKMSPSKNSSYGGSYSKARPYKYRHYGSVSPSANEYPEELLRSALDRMSEWTHSPMKKTLNECDIGLKAKSTVVLLTDYDKGWTKFLEPKFSELLVLEQNWDGYEGGPLDAEIADRAKALLERIYCFGVVPPSLVPGGDGSLQIEWHINDIDLEIDILEPEYIKVRFCADSGIESRAHLDERELSTWVSRLKVDG